MFKKQTLMSFLKKISTHEKFFSYEKFFLPLFFFFFEIPKFQTGGTRKDKKKKNPLGVFFFIFFLCLIKNWCSINRHRKQKKKNKSII